MGKPVEVRVLSRAVSFVPQTDLQQKAKQKTCNASWMTDYFAAAFLLAAQRAFINWESFLRPAGVSWPFFFAGAFFVPAAFLLAAQRAFINWESFLRPAGVSWPFLLVGAAVVAPLFLAQRALAAAASFARVAGEK